MVVVLLLLCQVLPTDIVAAPSQENSLKMGPELAIGY